MMKLSTMLKVDSTVDTQWQSRIAERILEHWEYDQGSAQFFRSSTNFVYVFSKGGGRYFLRFADSTERTGAAIEAEMALLCWVASKGMSVTTPIASKKRYWLFSPDRVEDRENASPDQQAFFTSAICC